MEQYISKDAIVAEIERRLEAIASSSNENNRELSAIYGAQQYELINLIQHINTLEVKEVDFEKETKRWWKEYLHLNPENKLWMDAHQSVVFAKHFYELGLKAQKGE